MEEKNSPQDQNTSSEEPSEIAVEEATESGIEKENTNLDWPAFAIAGIFALLIISLSLLFYSLNLRSSLSQKDLVIEKKNALISELESSIQKNNEIFTFLEGRNITIARLSGLEISPASYGKIFLREKAQKLLLQVSNVPSTEESEQYKLWIFKNNETVEAGAFTIQDRSSAFFIFDGIPDISGTTPEFAISLEPEGDEPHPTGEFYLMSERGSAHSK